MKEWRKEGGKEGRKEGRNEGTKERRTEGAKERRNEGTKERRNEGTKERRNEGLKEWWNEWRIEGMKDWMMKEGMNGWMDERMNMGFRARKCLHPSIIVHKYLDPLSFLRFRSAQSKCFAMQIKLSLQSGAHFADLIFHVAKHFEVQIELLQQSRADAGLVFPKRCDSSSILKCKSSSRDCFVRFLWTTLPDRAPKPRKQRPSFGDPGSHITRINTGFHVRQCFNPWIHTFPSCRSSLLLPHANCSCSLCCWHDDDMTVTWWRWWQDCPWTFVGNLDFFELNFLWLNYIYYYKWMLSPSSNRFRGKWNPDDDKIWIKSRFDPPANIKYIKHLKQTVVFRLLLAINLWMLG